MPSMMTWKEVSVVTWAWPKCQEGPWPLLSLQTGVMTSWSLVSIVRVQIESLPRLGPVVSTMGSYMKYQKDMQRGLELPSISWLTKKALSPAFCTLSLASWMKKPP